MNADLQDRLHAAPWEFSYQMGEKYLDWGEELQQKLYARVAADELNITEGQLVEYLDRLRMKLLKIKNMCARPRANEGVNTCARIEKTVQKILNLKTASHHH